MVEKIRWLGVAFIEFITNDKKTILFDPWTKTDGSPTCPFTTLEIKNVDLLVVSHDHHDHIGSATEICKNTGALIAGPEESLRRLVKEEGLPEEQAKWYIVGGGFELDWVKIVSTPAIHTSRTSVPVGTIIISKNGHTVYHAGDTSITGEMEIFAQLYPLDVAILPIFGYATMDYLQASEAVRLMKPKKVMPIHFDLHPEPEKTLNKFIELCSKQNPDVEIIVPKVGQYFELEL